MRSCHNAWFTGGYGLRPKQASYGSTGLPHFAIGTGRGCGNGGGSRHIVVTVGPPWGRSTLSQTAKPAERRT